MIHSGKRTNRHGKSKSFLVNTIKMVNFPIATHQSKRSFVSSLWKFHMAFIHLRPSSQQHWWEEFLPWAMTEFHMVFCCLKFSWVQAGDPDGMTSEIDGRKLMACMAGRVDELIPKMAIFERSHPFPKHQNIIWISMLHSHLPHPANPIVPYINISTLSSHTPSRQGRPCWKVLCEPNAMNRRGACDGLDSFQWRSTEVGR